ncbi:AI-2E family transporter [Bradymonas sediminis]|uniref:Uncharacterized protein n=1 Tax=Bradymonas sediminis TaxID=1548548 RepID=A0A2Z4FI27_9DELT|nr:AI-2E family transporter [Bradymonas sediminis]AWV88346.1 hypothetical protein DN745_02905 [Bradymonas sediminis]TDP77472.1 putative PurR-regulated permease PerM [Bradymonas sediminis]
MASFIGEHPDEHLPDGAPEETPPRDAAVGPALFPRLSAQQYRARVWRYVYISMRILFFALIVAIAWWLSISMGTLLTPLLGSFILGYLLDPLVRKLQGRGLSRRAATLVCLGSVFALIAVVLLFLLPSIISQLSYWIGNIPELIGEIQDTWFPWITTQIETRLPESMQETVQGYISDAANALPGLAQRIGGWGVGAVSGTGRALFAAFNLILIPLFTYYFLMKFARYKTAVVEWIPRKRRAYYLSILARMDVAVGQWFRGQLLVAAIVGALYAIGLAIVFALFGIDFQLGIAIGVAAGITNIIPYLGMILAIAMTALVVLLDWPGWIGILFVVGVFLVNHILEAYIVGPKVLGDSVDMNPIAVIILLLAGGELAGLWGILLVIPIAGAVKVIIPDLRALYQETTIYQGGEVDLVAESPPEPDESAQKSGPDHALPASPST